MLRCELKPDHRLVPYPGIVERVVGRFEARGLLPRTVYTSFHLPTIEAVLALGLPLRGVIWLLAEQTTRLLGPGALATLARQTRVRSVAVHQALLDDTMLARLREAELEVGAFAVLEDEAIERVLRQRVAVFTTDMNCSRPSCERSSSDPAVRDARASSCRSRSGRHRFVPGSGRARFVGGPRTFRVRIPTPRIENRAVPVADRSLSASGFQHVGSARRVDLLSQFVDTVEHQRELLFGSDILD